MPEVSDIAPAIWL